MREFIVRARRAPVDPNAFLAGVGREPHVEYLARMVIDGLFVSKGHRRDAVLTLTLEKSSDYSRSLQLDGRTLGDLGGLDERALLATMADALAASRGLGKEQSVVTDSGIYVSTVSFERLIRQKVQTRPVYVLDRKGGDIRQAQIGDDPVFVMTDHIPMPRKTFNSLARQGVEGLSVGPVTLHTSQCLVLIHNELDRRGQGDVGCLHAVIRE